MTLKLKPTIALMFLVALSSSAFAEEGRSGKVTKVSVPALDHKKTENREGVGSASSSAPIPLTLPLMNIEPTRSPFLDTKQVVYPYDANKSFPILTRPGVFTQIDLPEGFVVEGFYLSNSSEEDWVSTVSKDSKHIFIKPTHAGLFNSGSIISGNTSYLLAISSQDDGEWYQRVKWTMTKSQLKKLSPMTSSAAAGASDTDANKTYFENYSTIEDSVNVKRKQSANVAKINTKWSIIGDASFKPTSVYDDGEFTYIVFPKIMNELPALFSINSEGESELINYLIEGEDRNQIKVTRLLTGALLKLGKSEIKLVNENKSGFSFSKFFGAKDQSSPLNKNSAID